MLKKIKSKWLKILIVLLIVAIVVLAVMSASWLVYYNSKVEPLMKCLDKYDFVSDYDAESGLTYYSYQNEEEMISYDLSIPGFLNYFSDVQVMTGHLSDFNSDTGEITNLTDYTYYFRYIADVFGDGSYSFRIDDYTGVSDSYEEGVFTSSGPSANYNIKVDKDMNFLSGDKGMYDEHYDQLKAVFDKAKEIFGEDAL